MFWTGYPIAENNYLRYPIRKSDYFDDEIPGEFGFLDEENYILSANYENGDICWTYSAELMKVNARNIEELLIKPAVELLENKKLILNNHTKLKEAIIHCNLK